MASNKGKIRLFRMVHHSNIEHILINGLHIHSSSQADPSYIGIGDTQLIRQRKHFKIEIEDNRNLGDYIPFYFSGHTPMLLNIKTGHRGITKRKQDEIVFLVCEANDIVSKCSKWLFTDGHAKDALSKFYTDLVDLEKLDWSIIKARFWKNSEEDFDKMRRKQAEFLIYKYVPINCIKGLIVKKESRKLELEKIILHLGLALKIYVDVDCKYYYP